jgi:hypothetical protein
MAGFQEYFGSFAATRDRRQHSRKTAALNYVTLGDSNGGIILNISEGGLALTAAEVLVGEYLPSMRFQLAEVAQSLETSGRIVWMTGSKKEAGIQFVNLANEDRNQIRQWISLGESPPGIQDAKSTVRESEKQVETPPLPASKKFLPELEFADETEERHFEELFPSEGELPLETSYLTSLPVQPPITKANGPAGHSIPDFGYQSRNDWVEPATIAHRSKSRLVLLSILLTAVSFAIGIAFERRSSERLLERTERAMPQRSEPAPSPTSPPADSVAERSGQSAAAASQSHAEISSQHSQTPASPIPGASVGGNEEIQATGTPSEPPRITKRAENKTVIVDQPREPRLVTAPGEGNQPFLLTMPSKAVSASSSLAISYQCLILVPLEPGLASSHQWERLEVGGLIFHVDPLNTRAQALTETVEIVKLRASVDENGQVTDVERISGPMPLIPGAMSAIREWRYVPTLLNGRPIKTEEDVLLVYRAR